MPDPCPTLPARTRRTRLRAPLAAAALLALGTGLATVPGAAATAVPATSGGAVAAASARVSTVGTTAAAALPADPDQPLAVSLDTLAPAVLPARGPVRMTGSVTNTSDAVWTDVNLLAFSSSTPITTDAALSEALATDPAADLGPRTTAEGSFDTVAQLGPGESAPFSLRVPRDELAVPAGAEGVFWLGVHALGTSPEGRDGLADGRARTFVASVPRSAPTTPVSLVVPLRRPVAHEPDGSIAGVERWVEDLGPGGSLRALVDLGAAAGDRPVTWLVDPAVLEAADRLAAGNPARSLEPTLPPPGQQEPGDGDPSGSGGPSGSASPSGDPSGSATDEQPGASPTDEGTASSDGEGDNDEGGDAGNGGGSEEPPTAVEQEAALLAEVWLARVRSLAAEGDVLALPYADLDVAAAVHREPSLYTRAAALTALSAEAFDLAATPAAAPPGGRLDAASVAALPEDALVLLEPDAVPDAEGTVVEAAGHRLLLTDPAGRQGGPGPDDPLATVAVRQRLLAEAAVASLTGPRAAPDAPEPLVVVLPARWNPRDGLGFFGGLEQAGWVRLQTVGTTAGGEAREVDGDQLAYGPAQRRTEVVSANLEATTGAVRAGALLESILTRNDQVGTAVARQALGSASYAARRAPRAWRRAARRTEADVRTTLAQVEVEAPPGTVTLSSETGGFPASLVNGLDQPVTVRIEARTTSPLTVEAPAEVDLQPGERTSVLLDASTRRIGLHDVELVVTNTDGIRLGSSDELEIRSAQVSWIIWVVVAGGGTLLFGAIGVRLVRRFRASRRTAAVA